MPQTKKSKSLPVLRRKPLVKRVHAWLCGEGDGTFSLACGLRKHLRYDIRQQQWLDDRKPFSNDFETRIHWNLIRSSRTAILDRFDVENLTFPGAGGIIEVVIELTQKD